jgi:hypothetical protein
MLDGKHFFKSEKSPPSYGQFILLDKNAKKETIFEVQSNLTFGR